MEELLSEIGSELFGIKCMLVSLNITMLAIVFALIFKDKR